MENNQPLVSVIMNCYNSDKYLTEAIESVIAQTYTNWEIIFWDNQSTDQSAEIVKSYNDERIKYFYAPTFEPLYGARNYATEKANGEYITFLDCDDKWLDKKLELQLQVLHNTEYSFCYSNYFNLQNGELKKAFCEKQPSGDIFKYQISNYSIGILTVMFKKERWNKMEKKFNENYNYPGDFDFFIRFLYENKAIYIDECLCEYRADNPNSLSNTKVKENIVEMGDAIESLEEKYLNNETKPYFKILRSRLNLKESLHYIKMNKRIKARLVAKKYKFFRLKNLVVYLFTYLPNNLLQILLTKI